MLGSAMVDPAGMIGRSARQTDIATAAPIEALAAALDLAAADLPPDGAFPPLWHWLLFLDNAPAHALGDDGHRAEGGLVPHMPDLPRRMWAGGRLRFHRPIFVGQKLRRDSEILTVSERQGRSGRLMFVTVGHVIRADDAAGTILIEEEQDLVFRPLAVASPAKVVTAAPGALQAVARRSLVPGPVLLFRFSALTYNAHRIHYDTDYARDVEHYPGLVVHGPLQAILLAGEVRRAQPAAPLLRFDFRAESPAFSGRRLDLEAAPATDRTSMWRMRSRNEDGVVCIRAEAELG